MKKINPKKDNLKTALIKKGVPIKIIEAIISGYEGFLIDEPISIFLHPEDFLGKNLLIKTLMAFKGEYEPWNNDLYFIDVDRKVTKAIQSLLDEF